MLIAEQLGNHLQNEVCKFPSGIMMQNLRGQVQGQKLSRTKNHND
jgi:hypothetical protein